MLQKSERKEETNLDVQLEGLIGIYSEQGDPHVLIVHQVSTFPVFARNIRYFAAGDILRSSTPISVHLRWNHPALARVESRARRKKELTLMHEKKAQMEAVYTHIWASHEGGPFAPLDESLHPRPHSMLYEVASACGVDASSLVLDVGSGRGNHSCALTQRFGCAVVGLDVAPIHVEQGRSRAVQEGVSDRVSFVQGDIEALPFEDERFDFLWSRDMLMHVPALPRALVECARVLKPEGAMLVYTTVATGRMEPKEAAWLYASFGLVPESMDDSAVEAAFQAAGFQMHSKEQLGSELMEWVEEHEGRASRELMRLARMLRKKEYYQELLSARRYEVALANYHWAIYILLGKLRPTLYVLRKTAQREVEE